MQTFDQFVNQNEDLYLNWLLQACRQPSVSATNQGMAEMKEHVKMLLEKVGATITEIQTEGYPIIYGELNYNKERTLTFYNHYDVQPADPLSEWESNPFEPSLRDGKVFARGVADNKGNLVARICAVHAYQQAHGELPVNIKFIFEGEEEVGSPHLEYFANNHGDKLQTDALIWEGGLRDALNKRLHVGLGVKGIFYAELVCNGANTDLHSSEAAIIENPAWRLTWALSTLKDSSERILIEGFYDDVRQLSKEDQEFIRTIDYDEASTLKLYQLNQFNQGLTGEELKTALIASPTCTICGLESGYTGEGAKTVLPSVAMVKLDFRLVPDQKPERIHELLRAHLDRHGFSDIEIRPANHLTPFNTKSDHPFVDTVLKSVSETYQEKPIIYRNLAGSSPMYNLLKGTDIPAVQVGVANTQSRFHAPNENIFIDDYFQGIKLTGSVIKNFSIKNTEDLKEGVYYE